MDERIVHAATALGVIASWLCAAAVAPRVLAFPNGAARMRPPMVLFALVTAAVTLINTSPLVAVAISAFSFCAALDAETGVVFVPIPLVIVALAVVVDPHRLFDAFVVALPFALLAWRSAGVGLGWGDVAIAAAAGAIAGAWAGGIACVVATLFAIVIARQTAQRSIAFVPVLAACSSVAAAVVSRI